MQNDSKPALIIDTGNHQCDGRLLDRDFLISISHTLLPIHELAKECGRRGIPCVTPDAFLSQPKEFEGKPVLLITHLTNERTWQMVNLGAVPFLLLCQESPFIATKFYLKFRSISKRFLHTMAFEGMRKRAHPRTVFHTMRFPAYVENNLLPSAIPFSERKETVLIAGNKNAGVRKAFLLRLIYGTPIALIYPRRRTFVEALAKTSFIDLYGKGWGEDDRASIRTAARGMAPMNGKHKILGTYKFTLCFENAVFPGYHTEKIFDAFLAGSIPVYLGDPEITAIVPKETFIDTRNYANDSALIEYLRSIDSQRFEIYREAARRFLASPTFEQFTHHAFIRNIIDLIESYER